MKQKYLYILSLFSAILFSACNENEIISPDDTSEAVELAGIQASIAEGHGPVTRADGNTTELSDHIGRYNDFIKGDRLVFTSIRRTTAAIPIYTYKGIEFYYDMTDGSLKRDMAKGTTAASSDAHPDKIYWSDAKNGHTFIGYSIPQVPGFDWNDKTTDSGTVYYGSIGNPVDGATPAIIDYDNTADGNQLITNDDILFTWDDNKVADNAVAYIDFYHGLALVRVQVSLSGFATDKDKDDVEAVASKMIFKNMPTMYKWDQSKELNHKAKALDASDQTALNGFNWGTGKATPNWNQTKDVHFWCPRPTGDKPGETGNKYTFYALAVPRTGVDGQQVEFTVTYPKPMEPTETEQHTYKATLPNGIEFRAGYCTTITINLDHKNEKITIGAEYIDWEFDPHPDDGSLKKNETFLKSVEMSTVTMADETGVTIDNATWLFKGQSTTVYDIYMNDGTADHPYQIRTAAQLLSFAKEVNNGRTFDGKYISLDAGLYLQKSTTDTSLQWPGIGTAGHPFQGTFIGGMRRISRLHGNSLFVNIGDKGHVGQILLEDVISIKDGHGALADNNAGIIDACKVEGLMDKILIVHTNGTVTYAGALCGENRGMIVGCYALGKFCGNATTVGGLVGHNTGAVVASYAALQTNTIDQLSDNDKDGVTSGTGTITTTLGGVVGDGTCQYCFYCSDTDYTTSNRTGDPATGKTANDLQRESFVGVDASTNVNTNTLNGAIHYWCTDAAKSLWPQAFQTNFSTIAAHLKEIKFLSRVANFPIFDDSRIIQ